MKRRFMAVPPGALFGGLIRLHQLRNDVSVRGRGDAEVLVEKKSRRPSLRQVVSPGLTWLNPVLDSMAMSGMAAPA